MEKRLTIGRIHPANCIPPDRIVGALFLQPSSEVSSVGLEGALVEPVVGGTGDGKRDRRT
jgi:hypothetical protein